MRKILYDKTSKNAKGDTFKSSNLIPKDVRTLFKRKGKLSKAYRKVKTINRCASIMRKLLEIDIKLKNHYKNKLLTNEMKVFDKAKQKKNVLFNYIKKKQKTSKNIGPFIKDKVLINEHPSEVLRKQFK